jgi:TolB-like protein
MTRHFAIRAAGSALTLFALATPAVIDAQARIQDTRPTLAVFDFENGSFPNNKDFQPLTRGMPRILASELARNTALRVVDRSQIRAIMDEQDLQKSDRVDQSTAVKLGKILGARHILLGSYTVDQKKNVRIDVNAVNTETSQLEHSETITGKSDEILDLVRKLSLQLNKSLKLPEIQVSSSEVGKSPASLGPNQERISQMMGRAEEELDRGNVDYAKTLMRNVLALNKNYELAQTRLATLEKGSK